MKEPIKHTVVEIFTHSPRLGLIVNKVEQLSKLNRLVHEKLDCNLAKYCRVANVRDGILILTTSSPATGHLLRFAISDLLTALRAEPEWCHLKSIKTQVHPLQPGTNTAAKPSYPPVTLSCSNREMVASIAQTIDNPSLQQALHRLSQSPSPALII